MSGTREEVSFRTILGIRFFVGDPEEAVRRGLQGGLVVAPAAPLLATLAEDAATREALVKSDLALTDSGLMVLLWNFLKRDSVRRTSGLEYLKLLLKQAVVRQPGALFWIMPTAGAKDMALQWLKQEGHPMEEHDFYLAPRYGSGAIDDPDLLEVLSTCRPTHIVIAVGGGVQERLGYYLRRNLSDQPGIHCTGAAIGFLTGNQIRIPTWADRWYLGWFFRCLAQPGLFIPRYWRARRFIPLLWKYRERLPGGVQ